jgi:hypothetical protein
MGVLGVNPITMDYPKYLVTVDPPDLRKYRFIFDLFAKLFADPEFQRQLRCRWKELRAGPLDLARLNARIDGWVQENAPAVTRDRDRWQVAGKDLFGNTTVFQTYAEDIRYFKDFITRRLRWMDERLTPGDCAR